MSVSRNRRGVQCDSSLPAVTSRWLLMRRRQGPGLIGSVLYVSFEATVPGTAPHTHVYGLAQAIRDSTVQRCDVLSPVPTQSVRRKFLGYGRLTLQAASQAPHHDLILLRYHPAQLVLLGLLRITGRRILLEVNGVPEDAAEAHPQLRRLRRVLRMLLAIGCRLADQVVAVTENLQEYLQSVTDAPVIWAPNGTDVARFQPTDAGGRPRHVLFVGALTAWQGLPTLLAATRSELWPPDVTVTIVGDGPLRDSVVADDSPRVQYIGQASPERVVELYGLCSIALSPKSGKSAATSRGLSPLKVAEAHAAGCALVVSDLPGQADLVRRASSGLVVPPDDPDALALAVRTLSSDDDGRVKCMLAAREHALRWLSWTTTWATILESLERTDGRETSPSEAST